MVAVNCRRWRFQGVLVDAEADAASLKQRCWHLIAVAALEQVSEDGFNLDVCSFFQVAVHGRGELRVFRGCLFAYVVDQGLWGRESAGGGDGGALIDGL